MATHSTSGSEDHGHPDDEAKSGEDRPPKSRPGHVPKHTSGGAESAKIGNPNETSIEDDIADLTADLEKDLSTVIKPRGPMPAQKGAPPGSTDQKKASPRPSGKKPLPELAADRPDTPSPPPAAAKKENPAPKKGLPSGPAKLAPAPPEEDEPVVKPPREADVAAGEARPPASQAPPAKKGLSLIELLGFAGLAAILAGALYFLATITDDDIAAVSGDEPADSPNAPIAGEMVKIQALDAYWRPLSEDDRTDKTHQILPEISLAIDPGASNQDCFLKVHFLDEKNRISGDVRSVKVSGGQVVDSNRSEIVTGPHTVRVYGSKGITDRTAFLSYGYDENNYWSVEVFEGATYGGDNWDRIAYFRIPKKFNELRSGEPAAGDGGGTP